MVPTTEPAKRIAALFKRRPTTAWAAKEVLQYKKLVKDGCFEHFLDDLELIERYYVFERRKEDKGIHRRELQTFLNNYQGELDRAKLWDSRFRKPIRKAAGLFQPPTSDEEFKRLGDEAKKQLEAFKQKYGNGNCAAA